MTLTEFIAEAKRLVLDAYDASAVNFLACSVEHYSLSSLGERVEFSIVLALPARGAWCHRDNDVQECLAALERHLRPTPAPEVTVEALGALPTV